MQERVQELIDPDFWQRLCPELHVCDPASGPKARRGVFPLMAEDRTELVDELRGQMHRDGYFTLAAEGGGPAGMPWAVDLAAMGRAVATLAPAPPRPSKLSVPPATNHKSQNLSPTLRG
eukprot:CAMPEP_0182907952 /NCGR_PEP_ID=MMETSP0034_2-20130328/34879_1 /TAXON_ID=156128 /ORGANISM="Nephroselmis pyriformis, Strain CCMP717" /LENGTH=118 /DNA_ID=CAMNT_0025044035 /DNA_START=20 /DNA_END=376 /DNA_ORIENTATION=+